MDAQPPVNVTVDTTAMYGPAEDLGADARAFRADPRNVPAEAVMAYHDLAVKKALKVLKDVDKSLARSGPLTRAAVADFDDEDRGVNTTLDSTGTWLSSKDPYGRTASCPTNRIRIRGRTSATSPSGRSPTGKAGT